MITDEDLNFVRNTFCSNSMITCIQKYNKKDNVVEYCVNRWRVRFSMYADEFENKYYIKQEIFEDQNTPGAPDFLARQKVY
jgi:hypothetical protein